MEVVMKKFILGLGFLFAVGLFVTQVMAWNGNHTGNRHGNMEYKSGVSERGQQQYMHEANELRNQIDSLRTEMNMVMSQQNPDINKARKLKQKIMDKRNKLRELHKNYTHDPQNSYSQSNTMHGNSRHCNR